MSADLWFAGAVVSSGNRSNEETIRAMAALSGMAAAKRATTEAEDR